MRALALFLLLVCLGPARAGAAEVTRTSEPTQVPEAASEGWAGTGFRTHLQVGWSDVVGHPQQGSRPPGGTGVSFSLRPGVKVDRHLELSAALRYTIIDHPHDTWLRFALTLDGSYYFTQGFFAGAGLGYGGMWNGDLCRADGPQALIRTGALYEVGDVFAMGPVAEADISVSSCGAGAGASGQWLQHTLSLSWSFSWR